MSALVTRSFWGDLWLVGGLHDGLDDLPRAQDWLRGQANAYDTLPAFLGCEWSETVYEAVIPFSDHLRSHLRDKAWPGASDAVLDAAVSSLCWEAKAVLNAF